MHTVAYKSQIKKSGSRDLVRKTKDVKSRIIRSHIVTVSGL